jgi:hypothetical protein
MDGDMDTLYDQELFYSSEDFGNFVEESEAFLGQWDVPELNGFTASGNLALDGGFIEEKLPALASGDNPMAGALGEGSRQHVNMPLLSHGPIPPLHSIERGDPTLSTDYDHRFTETADPLVYYGFDEHEASNYQHADHPATTPAVPPFVSEATYDLNWVPDQSLHSADFHSHVIEQIEQLKDE